MTYLTPNRYGRISTFAISLPQTELRRGKKMHLASFKVEIGQRLQLRVLSITVLRILTPGVTPTFLNRPLNVASVGLYLGPMICSPIAAVTTSSVGTESLNAFAIREVFTPGTYNITVANNTSNIDIAVSVVGAVKLFF